MYVGPVSREPIITMVGVEHIFAHTKQSFCGSESGKRDKDIDIKQRRREVKQGECCTKDSMSKGRGKIGEVAIMCLFLFLESFALA